MICFGGEARASPPDPFGMTACVSWLLGLELRVARCDTPSAGLRLTPDCGTKNVAHPEKKTVLAQEALLVYDSMQRRKDDASVCRMLRKHLFRPSRWAASWFLAAVCAATTGAASPNAGPEAARARAAAQDQAAPAPAKVPSRLDSTLAGIVRAFERHRQAPAWQAADAAERARQRDAAARAAASRAPIHDGASVAATFHTDGQEASDQLRAFLAERGGDARNVGEDFVEAYVPVPLLAAAAGQPGVARVAALRRAHSLRGRFNSQGVAAHRAATWHSAGYTGRGVKVGVIDSGFEGIRLLIGADELPEPSGVRCHVEIGRPSSDLQACEEDLVGGTRHGTGVAETLIDVAPDVDLYIGKPVSQADLQAIAEWMAAQGVQVINYSVGWLFDGPGDGTSPYGVSPLNTVAAAVDNGIVWVNAAGNSGEQSWYGAFRDADADGWHGFDAAGEDRCNWISVLGAVDVQLRWEDEWGGAARDLDLYLLSEEGETLAASDDAQIGLSGQVPFEFLTTQSQGGRLCLAVKQVSGMPPAWIQMIVMTPQTLEHSTRSGGITNPAESASPGVVAVGATDQKNTAVLQPYSSRGPAPDGRRKPDIVAVDGTESRVYGTFYGTSAAAPHVAGLAALTAGARPAFSPARIAATLKSQAAERGPMGDDNEWGHGFAQLGPPPQEADLAAISLSQGVLAPKFSPLISNYDAEVDATVTAVTLTATPMAGAVLTISPPDTAPDADGHQLALDYGSNDVVLRVESPDGLAKIYRVRVRRGAADVDLAGLRLSQGALTPPFARGVADYATRLGDQLSATRVTVHATLSDDDATAVITPDDLDSVEPGHQVPLVAGDNVIEVRVDAPAPDAVAKTYRVVATRAETPADHAPTADAGEDQTVDEEATVTLRGGGTDPEGAPLTFAWQQRAGRAVTLSSATAQAPTFTAPNLSADGELVFALTVSDGAQPSEVPDLVTITVRADNDPPVAEAGADVDAARGSTVHLDGGQSVDPEGETLANYAWTQTDGPAVTLRADADRPERVSFVAPAADATLTFELTVSDGTSTSNADTVRVRVLGSIADYDADDDGLIEIASLAALNAVRWDTSGTGAPADEHAADYFAVFAQPATNMGCPPPGCRGYELTADLDLNVAPYNTGRGWSPFPDFAAAFVGNGHTIANLTINQPFSEEDVAGFFRSFDRSRGLFKALLEAGRIEGVRLVNANVTSAEIVGGLVGHNEGVVRDCHVSGAVTASNHVELAAVGVGGLVGLNSGAVYASSSSATVRTGSVVVGGLVGFNGGTVAASYATGAVIGNNTVGGLAGGNGGRIIASYATGPVTGNRWVGGLVGDLQWLQSGSSEIIASYAIGRVHGRSLVGGLAGSIAGRVADSYWDVDTTGQRAGGGGRATAQLRSPTAYTDLYANWNVDVDGDGEADDPWSFGTSGQYPVLHYGGLDVAAQFEEQAGHLAGDADLVALAVDGATTHPPFDRLQTVYGANAGDVARVTVTATPAAAGAVVSVTPADVDANAAGHQIDVSAQRVTTVAIGVRAPDGVQRTYSVKVARDSRDTDADGLIEVSTAAQLDAMRWDISGDGRPDLRLANAFTLRTDHYAIYADAFATAESGAECPHVCFGYELVADVDLNIAPYDVDGWTPIGGLGETAASPDDPTLFAAFRGNDHAISNLRIDQPEADFVGLFGSADAHIEGVRLVNANVSGRRWVGGLVGYNDTGGTILGSAVAGVARGGNAVGLVAGGVGGTVAATYARGVAHADQGAGGLAGENTGDIVATYADVRTTGNAVVGGLVGHNQARVVGSYAVGATAGGAFVGGLVGFAGRVDGTVAQASYWDIETTGQAVSAQGQGLPSADLHAPTEYAGIYAEWDLDVDGDGERDDPWDFGTAAQYPALRYGGLDADAQFRAQAEADDRADLVSLDIDAAGLRPAFDPARTAYTLVVAPDRRRVTFTFQARHPDATTTITPADADPGADGHQVDLALGVNTIIVAVATADGTAFNSYLVNVLRGNNDADFDGLVEIATPAQLHAIRWDLDGNGQAENPANRQAYAAAFDAPESGLICASGCRGYELAANLDLDVAPYNADRGWQPIGTVEAPYAGVLQGNGHAIDGLFVRASTGFAGLFGAFIGARVEEIALVDVDVAGAGFAGGLAGLAASGTATGIDVSGAVTGDVGAGGLVGSSIGAGIKASFSSATVQATQANGFAGGLAGTSSGDDISASYATGPVTAPAGTAGGIIGFAANTAVTASYSTGSVAGGDGRTGGLIGVGDGNTVAHSYWDTDTSVPTSAGGEAKTTSELQAPEDYVGIFAEWNVDVDGEPGGDAPWDFGLSDQYPALRYARPLARIGAQDARRDAALAALAFDPPLEALTPPLATRPVSPMPSHVGVAAAGAGEVTVTATPARDAAAVSITPADADGDAGNGHQVALREDGATHVEVRVTSADEAYTQRYDIALWRDAAPAFAAGVADQMWRKGVAIAPLALPAAEGGNPPFTYELRPPLAAGLERIGMHISGTPAAIQTPVSHTWTATDVDGDVATLTFATVVEAPIVPPDAPGDFRAVAGANSLTLRWRALAELSYQYRIDGGEWMPIPPAGEGMARHSLTGLENGAVYTVALRAVRAELAGAAAEERVALAAMPAAAVDVPDDALRAAIAAALGKPDAALTELDMAALHGLDAPAAGVADLTGIEFALNLRALRLPGNRLANFAPLASLVSLATLDLRDTGFADLSALSTLTALTALWLGDNAITHIEALRDLPRLRTLALDGNAIVDISALYDLTALAQLWLDGNAISDIGPLEANTGIGGGPPRADGSGDYVDLRRNPLYGDALAHVDTLRERGATVLFDDGVRMVPHVVSTVHPARRGLVRVISRGDDDGQVATVVFDRGGRRLGAFDLPLLGRAVAAFNSQDLAHGNPAKGIVPSVGAGYGDWRLEMRSQVPFRALAYGRDGNGTLSDLSGFAPERYARHDVGFFNPGSNRASASRLLLINPGDKAAHASIAAVDDRAAAGSASVVVPERGWRLFAAADLEAGVGTLQGALGDGHGKWRLTVTSFDGVRAASLLEAADGYLANLSAPSVPLQNDVYRLAWLPARDASVEGFVRVQNRSDRAGVATLRAFDDSGREAVAATLRLEPLRTVHFTGADLEAGDAAKQLTGVGAGEGDWRLELRADLDLRISAYLRGPQGSLTSIHDVAGKTGAGARVDFFNPGDERVHASHLRIVNNGGMAADVTITSVDDLGRSPGDAVRLTIPAHAARMVSAEALETGAGPGLSGALGDGVGKWRLTVSADGDVDVLSLLENTDTGHVVNVSTVPTPVR